MSFWTLDCEGILLLSRHLDPQNCLHEGQILYLPPRQAKEYQKR